MKKDHRKMYVCKRGGRERREGGIEKQEKKNLFAISLAGADAVYTPHRGEKGSLGSDG